MADDPDLTTVPPLPDVVVGLAPPDESGWYHLRDGFYFKGDGTAVTIAVRREDDPHAFRVLTVPPNEWASVVASVSKRGDVQSAWSEALALHEKGKAAKA